MNNKKIREILDELSAGIIRVCRYQMTEKMTELRANLEVKEKMNKAFFQLKALKPKIDEGALALFLINVCHLDEPIRKSGARVNGKTDAREIIKDIAHAIAEKAEEWIK